MGHQAPEKVPCPPSLAHDGPPDFLALLGKFCFKKFFQLNYVCVCVCVCISISNILQGASGMKILHFFQFHVRFTLISEDMS